MVTIGYGKLDRIELNANLITIFGCKNLKVERLKLTIDKKN